MRKNRFVSSSDYRIMILDDEMGIIDSLSVILRRQGYEIEGYTDPMSAIEKLSMEHYDLLILDYFMSPIHGDKVVERIREFNSDLYILLLTGHKDMAPPLKTIKMLEIQGYCEKSDRFEQLLLLVESAIKSVSQSRRIRKFNDGLNSILNTVARIYQIQPYEKIAEEIILNILPIVNGRNGFIIVNDILKAADGSEIFIGTGKFQTSMKDPAEILNSRFTEQIRQIWASKQILRLDAGILFPLITESMQAIGVLYIECEDMEDSMKLLKIYVHQAASALNNAFLHTILNIKNEELSNTYDQLKVRYIDTIEALRLAVDAKDIYTRGHSDRVAYFAVRIGRIFNLTEKDLEVLRVCGIFHDIGKIGISDKILLKTEKLTDIEFEEIKKHPLKGAYILSAISIFKEIALIVKSHHERIDGTGYPEGLKGGDIPFLSRILAVADAFDAMMSDRTYRSRLSLKEVKNHFFSLANLPNPNSLNSFSDLLYASFI